MREETDLLYHASQTTVTGFLEVAKRYRFLRRVFDDVVENVRRRRPTLAILVDYPGFNLRLAPILRREGIPVFYYIAPQVWAWKEGRVRILRENVDEMAVLFPFEVEYFARHGIDAHFFGHPLINRLDAGKEERKAAAERLKGSDDRPVVAWLPGSRPNEIRRHLPIIVEAASLIGNRCRHIVARADTIDTALLDSMVPKGTEIEFHDGAAVVLEAADAAIVKSGTSTLETALIGTPFGVIYRTSFASYRIAKALAKVESIAMVNLLAGKQVVREFIQNECNPQALAAEIDRLLVDTAERERMRAAFVRLREELFVPDTYLRTAEFVAERFLKM